MSKTTKFYSVRDRFNRYKKAVKDIFTSRYYTESSRSHKRKIIAEDRLNTVDMMNSPVDKTQLAGSPANPSSAEALLHVHHRLDRPC